MTTTSLPPNAGWGGRHGHGPHGLANVVAFMASASASSLGKRRATPESSRDLWTLVFTL